MWTGRLGKVSRKVRIGGMETLSTGKRTTFQKGKHANKGTVVGRGSWKWHLGFCLPGTFNSGCKSSSPLRIHPSHILRPCVSSEVDSQYGCMNWSEPMRAFPGIFASSIEKGSCLCIGATKLGGCMPDLLCHCKGRACLRIKPTQEKPEPKTEGVTFLRTMFEHLDPATPEVISP